jgi:hypothetical protein
VPATVRQPCVSHCNVGLLAAHLANPRSGEKQLVAMLVVHWVKVNRF